MVLIALDDGHGMETPGKRSPVYNGKVMRENEFNSRVVELLNENLKRCGFDTLLVAPSDKDTSLSARVKLANEKNADFYLSVHANAFDNNLDNDGQGIETYAHFSYPKTVEKAKIIHKHIMQGSPFKDRGVKNGDWLYVCKYTEMSAALVELGFMDALRDLKYLLSEDYRQECADELAKALCEIYGKKWIPKPKPLQKDVWYQVISGSFRDRENAESQIRYLKDKGIDSFIQIKEG